MVEVSIAKDLTQQPGRERTYEGSNSFLHVAASTRVADESLAADTEF
jgi:hypothetical protein